MERKKKSIFVALGLSLALFVTLVALSLDSSYKHHAFDQAETAFGFNVDMRWTLKGSQTDFVAVQDTLNYYAQALEEWQLTSRADWQLDYCCGDKAVLKAFNDGSEMYHLSAAMNFHQLHHRDSLLGWMVANGWVDFGEYDYRYGLARGRVHLHLPMPTRNGEILHITGSKFEATFFANDWVEASQS